MTLNKTRKKLKIATGGGEKKSNYHQAVESWNLKFIRKMVEKRECNNNISNFLTRVYLLALTSK